MKAVFLSLFTLATSALAAPAVEANTAMRSREAFEVHARSTEADALTELNKRSVSTSAELIVVLQTCNTGTTSQCGNVDDLITKYKNGGLTKAECAAQAIPCFKTCINLLNVVISKCTGTGILSATTAEITTIAQLVISIVTTLLKTIASLVTACGLLSSIGAILKSLIAVICTLLTLICGIVPAIVSIIVPILTSLLATVTVLGAYLLPLVTCIAGL